MIWVLWEQIKNNEEEVWEILERIIGKIKSIMDSGLKLRSLVWLDPLLWWALSFAV